MLCLCVGAKFLPSTFSDADAPRSPTKMMADAANIRELVNQERILAHLRFDYRERTRTFDNSRLIRV
jgi:hypothetical protein